MGVNRGESRVPLKQIKNKKMWKMEGRTNQKTEGGGKTPPGQRGCLN